MPVPFHGIQIFLKREIISLSLSSEPDDPFAAISNRCKDQMSYNFKCKIIQKKMMRNVIIMIRMKGIQMLMVHHDDDERNAHQSDAAGDDRNEFC